MSYTELYKVSEKGPVELYAEFKNAFRGAMLVWMNLGEQYVGTFNMLDMQPVWDLTKNISVPADCRIVLASTFDGVMIKKENLPRFVQAVDEYAKRFDPGTLPEQCFKLGELVNDPTCYAVCWNQTSVCSGTWQVDECDEYRGYDISRDTGHWFLFDELDL